MKCYLINGNYGNSDFLDYGFARAPDYSERIRIGDYEGEWVPSRDLQYEHGGPMSYGAIVKGSRFTQETCQEFQKIWYVAQAKHANPLHVIKPFDENLKSIPLFSQKLKDEIEAMGHDQFEFLAVEKTWDDTHQQPLVGGPFFLANLLVRRDSWDQERTEIVPQKRADGSFFNIISGSGRAVLQSRIEGAMIWRDSLTQTVVCTETFKEIADTVGCSGWWFQEINVTDDR